MRSKGLGLLLCRGDLLRGGGSGGSGAGRRLFFFFFFLMPDLSCTVRPGCKLMPFVRQKVLAAMSDVPWR